MYQLYEIWADKCLAVAYVAANGMAAPGTMESQRMNHHLDENEIAALVLREVARITGSLYAPVAVSNRHVHLCTRDMEALFGKGYALTPMKSLVQPGQYAAKETVTLAGPKGAIENVRVLGPVRKQTQVEISITDSYRLGIAPDVRMSGDVAGTPGCVLKTRNGAVELPCGVMVSERHLHLSPGQAADFGLADGQRVKLFVGGPRAVRFENILVRCGPDHFLEVHLDMDEANAAAIKSGSIHRIIPG